MLLVLNLNPKEVRSLTLIAAAQVASLNATVMQQGAMLSAIRASILDVVDTLARPVSSPPSSPPPPCNGRGCRPTLVADGSNLNIQATAGGVTVCASPLSSSLCSQMHLDLCESSAARLLESVHSR